MRTWTCTEEFTDTSPSLAAEAEYLGMQAGVTAGTVLAVLLPVLIAMLCYASYVRNKRRGHTQPPFRRDPRPAVSKDPSLPSFRTPSPPSSASPVASWTAPQHASQPAVVTERPLGRAPAAAQYYSTSGESESSPPPPSLSSATSDSSSPGDSGREGGGSRHKRRGHKLRMPERMDGDYDTREPLDDRPVVFQNVLWDLETADTKQSSV